MDEPIEAFLKDVLAGTVTRVTGKRYRQKQLYIRAKFSRSAGQ
jgi:hypothetical protein